MDHFSVSRTAAFNVEQTDLNLSENKMEAIFEAAQVSVYSAMALLDAIFVQCNQAPKSSGLSTVKNEWKASWLDQKYTDLTLQVNCLSSEPDIHGEFLFIVRFNWMNYEPQILVGAKTHKGEADSFNIEHDGTALNEQLERAIESMLENDHNGNHYIELMNAYQTEHDDFIAGVERLSVSLGLGK